MRAILCLLAVLSVAACQPGGGFSNDPAIHAAAVKARQRVIDIVNKPITHMPRTEEAVEFPSGWFHPGAETPDFNTVDVRASQQLIYSQYTYVTSDVTPNEMFFGPNLEFNAMTKMFYVDRTLPKARLSEAEMLEINSLYRIIGRDAPAYGAP